MLRSITRHRLYQAWYLPILAMSMGIMFARILLMARVLDVENFATFSALLLVSATSNILACFGLFYKLQRELPVLFVRRSTRRAAVVLAQALIGAVGAALLCALLPLFGMTVAGIGPLVLAVGVFHGLSQQIFLIATTESRSRGEVLRYSWQNFFRATSMTLIALPIALYYDSAVLVIILEGVATLLISMVIMGKAYRKLYVSSIVATKIAFRGLPGLDFVSLITLLLVSIIGFLLTNTDRWLASYLLTKAEFAQYAFAWTVMLVALSLQALVNASVYPLIARRYAAFGRQKAFRISWMVSSLLLGAFALSIVPALLLANVVIPTAFPKYLDSIDLLPLMAIAAALRISDFWSSFMMIVGLEKRVLAVNLVSGVACIVIWRLAVFYFFGNEFTEETILYLAFSMSAVTYLASLAVSLHAARQKLS